MKTFWIKLSIDVSRNSGDVSHQYMARTPAVRSSDIVITRMITDQIGLHSVILPLLFKIENMPNKNVEKVIKGSWSYVSWYLLSLLDQFTLNDFSGQCNKSANMGGGGGPHSRSENTLRCTLKDYSCILNLQQCLDCKVASFFMAGLLKSSITYPRSREGVGIAYVFLSKRKLSLTQSI